MTLTEIRDKVIKLPTIMDLDDEVRLVNGLMTSIETPEMDWAAFQEIMDRLSISHMDTFYELNETNKGPFVRFSQWLAKMADRLDEPRQVDALNQFANDFRPD
jgi:hypothetical protein